MNSRNECTLAQAMQKPFQLHKNKYEISYCAQGRNTCISRHLGDIFDPYRLQLNVVCAHSWLLLNICSTRTTAMRIKNALVAWMRNGGQKCEACGINGTYNLPGQPMHAVTSSWSSLLLLPCSRSYGQEISFVVFKYLRCINNANGEMGLKADTEKVATLILGLFSHCLPFFFGHSENNVFLITTQEKKVAYSTLSKHLRAQRGQY